VLHLYSRYNRATSVRAASDDENTVSAYATIDPGTNNATLVLVNRALTGSRTAVVTLASLTVPDGSYQTLQLANLPGTTETFVSHTSNALKSASVAVAGGQFSITLPALSVTSVLLQSSANTPPAPGPSRLANLSVRARSGSGDNVLIVGFVVGGTGTKEILLRGIGPSLAPFGIGTPLADPALTLARRGSGPFASNDNWGANAAQIGSLTARVGAFALEAGSLDAALVANLSGDGYTAEIAGRAGGTGIALGEAYDADLSGPARLVNLSARTWVGPGADNLIAGFIVNGESSKTLLIRAVGPALTGYGVTGVLNDPILRIYRQGDPRPLFRNDDWGSVSYAHEIAATAERIGAFALTPASKDAVLLLDLPPGNYSAVVDGANDTTGVALVEVYEIR
jgi:hypothetical protein